VEFETVSVVDLKAEEFEILTSWLAVSIYNMNVHVYTTFALHSEHFKIIRIKHAFLKPENNNGKCSETFLTGNTFLLFQ